jgi:hypothetical protein
MAKPPPVLEAPKVTPKPKGPKITYIWMPDKDGNLVKADASIIKKSFSKLPQSAVLALQEYLITVEKKASPTRAMRQTLWNSLVDGAISAFAQGQKMSPWDVLDKLTKTTPRSDGTVINYVDYDQVTSDALLSKAAKDLGFTSGIDAQITAADFADFFKKLTEAAKDAGKQRTTTVTKEGVTEIAAKPSSFDANSFARDYLWAKVNVGDPKSLPSTVINQVTALKTLAKNNGLDYLSDKELANMAVQLSKGEMTLDTIKSQFNTKAAELYPLFADRLKANPNLTVMDLAEPYVARMAKWWEIDPTTIDLSNSDLDKFLRPDGTAGKVNMASLSEFDNYLKFHPNSEKTSWKNESARDLATGLARAMGFGV